MPRCAGDVELGVCSSHTLCNQSSDSGLLLSVGLVGEHGVCHKIVRWQSERAEISVPVPAS